MSNVPAGWHDDGSGRQRWWDGAAWTAEFADQPSPLANEPNRSEQKPALPKRGLAIAALSVGAAAFLTGLVPVLGILVGVTGVVLGLIAYSKKQPKALVVVGLALAGLGAAASVGMTVGVSTVSSNVVAQVEDSDASDSVDVKAEAPKPKPTSTSKPEPASEKNADKPKPTKKTEKPKPAAEPEVVQPAGPSDEEKSRIFDRALKDGLGISDSYQEFLLSDPSGWSGYVAGVRVKGGDAYVTLQVNRSTPDGMDLGQRAAKAISTLILQETVDSLDLSWVIVEDGAGTVIDQKMFSPHF